MVNTVGSEKAGQLVVFPEAEAVSNGHTEAKMKLPVLLLWESKKLLLDAIRHFSSNLLERCAEDLGINIAFHRGAMLAPNQSTQENQNGQILHGSPNI